MAKHRGEALLKPEKVELSTEEIVALQNVFSGDIEEFKSLIQRIAMAKRAIRGQPIEPEDIYSGLINIKDKRERTIFQNQLTMRLGIYCRFMAAIWPETADIWLEWADQEVTHYIGYKGIGIDKAVEVLKAKGMINQGITPIFMGDYPSQDKPKGRMARLVSRMKGSSDTSA